MLQKTKYPKKGRKWARNSIFGSGNMLQDGMRSLDFFFNLLNNSSHTVGLRLIQPLTEMSARNFPGDKSASGAYG
jgi:hypothetical protein